MTQQLADFDKPTPRTSPVRTTRTPSVEPVAPKDQGGSNSHNGGDEDDGWMTTSSLQPRGAVVAI